LVHRSERWKYRSDHDLGYPHGIPLPSGGTPLFIIAGSDGALWFTLNTSNKIGRITTAGAMIEFTVPTAGSGPYGITSGPDGAVWFTESTGKKIGRLSSGFLPSATHDLDGDGSSDVVWRNSAGNAAVWFMNGAQIVSANIATVPSAWSIVGQRDFNYDGDDDLLWRDSAGNTAIWFMNGASVSGTASLGTFHELVRRRHR